ncbi:hypothetical protein MPSI1_000196 [Malassezia psittaci]|uniref:Rab-GAP TBC domain-containing protein n=1 Tax=Malassezia psittaci TaxID=1821823 RepID=A0AAF0JCN6_9BASI|nr:hypothetical protein MPSI1_000196 [Malassezia psittaci]
MASDEAAYVRRTYAHFARVGVHQDGVDDGIEHTRYRIAPCWDAKQVQKILTQDLLEKDLQRQQALDRYGFFDARPNQVHREPIILLSSVYKKTRKTTSNSSKQPNIEQVTDARKKANPSQRETRRSKKWTAMTVMQEGRVQIIADDVVVRRRIYKGIPDSWRGVVWLALVKNPKSSLTQELADTPSAHDIQIDLDVPRTIRGHYHFHTRYGQGQRDLFNVLHAISLLCAECGYCQGMGPLAAMLLLYLVPDDAYAMLEQLHSTYHFHDMFRPGFPGLREELFVLQSLLSEYTPRTVSSLKDSGIAPSAYATGWYMTLFSGVLPFSSQLRIWDAFLLDGFDVITLAAVAIVLAVDSYDPPPSSDWLIEALSAPLLPESDDAVMHWIESSLQDPRTRRQIQNARQSWAEHSQAGTVSDLLV